MKHRKAYIQQKEGCVVGIQCGGEEFLDGRQIHGHVLNAPVIAMDGHSSGRYPKQEEEIPQPMGLLHG
jgi:hypothetical protein